MKRFFRQFGCIAIVAGICSCSFLDEDTSGMYTEKDIYGSEAALERAVLGCYEEFATSGFMADTDNEYFQPGSTLLHWGRVSGRLTDGSKRWVDCLSLTQFSKNPQNYNAFKGLYAAVYRCNKLLAALPESPVTDAYKTEIAAEARFIRAQAYFYLVRRWGSVPLHLDVPKTVAATSLPRTPFWEVYGQILSDLEFAWQYMRTFEAQMRINTPGTGRVCRHAAMAAQSLVYLTIGTLLAHSEDGDNFWTCSRSEVFDGFSSSCSVPDANTAFQKALSCAKEVLPETSATNTPYRLSPRYSDLFRWTEPEDYHSEERIFCLLSTNEMSSNSTLAMYSLPRYYMDTDNANNFGRLRPSRFLFQKWCEAYGGVKGSVANTSGIYVDCGDRRLGAALVYTSYPGQGMWEKPCYPAPSGIYCSTSDYTLPLPYLKKYYDPKYNYTAGYADLYLMRLAEIYLVAAEACANLCAAPSDTYGQEALGYVNTLLVRARNTENGVAAEPADWNAADIPDKDALIVKIFWERCFEMVGEQHEWYDTHRMGAKWLGENVTAPANAFLFRKEQEDYYNESDELIPGHRTLFYGQPAFGEKQVYPEAQADIRKGLLCAFPNDELVYNTALTLSDQNPPEIFWE